MIQRSRLADVAEFIRDGTHGSPPRTETGIPVLSAMNVKGGLLNFETDRYTSEAEYEAFNRRLPLASGDVLLTIVGTIGRAAVVDDVSPLVFQRSVAVVRPRADRLSSRFLYHVTQSASFQTQLDRAANKSSQAGVYLGKLGEVEIPLPPLPEQRRIAAILDQADALRAKRREALAQLDSLTQSIFIEMFGDPMENPSDWTLVEVGDVSDVQGGLQVSSARKDLPVEVPYLRVANVYRGRLQLDEIKTMRATPAEVDRTKLRENDLLVVEGHGNPDEIGRAALWNGSIAPCIHQNHLIRARFDAGKIDPMYACEYLNSRGGRQHLLRAGKSTSGLNTISVSEVRRTPVALPPLALQQTFATRIQAVESLKATHRIALAESDALFASLQYRAFAGQLSA